jgi:hypothetical protein
MRLARCENGNTITETRAASVQRYWRGPLALLLLFKEPCPAATPGVTTE